MSRVCEEFHCLPLVAVQELMEDPQQLALDVMELRAYSRAKDALDQAKSAKEEPKGPAAEWVWRVQAELLRRRRQGQKTARR